MEQKFKNRNRLLVQALKANKKKAKNAMANKAGGHCCLCVAEKVALANGCEVVNDSRYKEQLTYRTMPLPEVSEWYGWNEMDPTLHNSDSGSFVSAADMNDSDLNIPHSIIAEFFANKFVHPKKQRWSERAEKLKEKL